MKPLTRVIGMGLPIGVLNAPAFAHPGHGPSSGLVAAPEGFIPDLHYLLPVIAAGLVMTGLLCYRHLRSGGGTPFRDWLARRRR